MSSHHQPSASWLDRLLIGTGVLTVLASSADVKLILAQRFVRVFAFGLVSLLLAAYLAAIGHSETQIGMFFGLTLLGDLLIVMVLTQIADAVGRRTILIVGAVSMTASGIVFSLTDNYWILLPAAVVGVISPR
jgi:MFS family permease